MWVQQSWLLGSRSWASVVGLHRLSCSMARGIFPDQGSNLCLLHWQTDYLSLNHPGSPELFYFYQKWLPLSEHTEIIGCLCSVVSSETALSWETAWPISRKVPVLASVGSVAALTENLGWEWRVGDQGVKIKVGSEDIRGRLELVQRWCGMKEALH